MAAGEPRGRGYSGAHLLPAHTHAHTHTLTRAVGPLRRCCKLRREGEDGCRRAISGAACRVGSLGGKQRAAPVLLLRAGCAACLARAAGIIKIYAHTVIHLPGGGESVGIRLAHPSYWFHSFSQPATTQLLEQLCL